MSSIRNMVIAGALAISTIVPMSLAEAMPFSGTPQIEKTTDVTVVRWCGRYRCERRRPRFRVYVEPRIYYRPAPRYIVREPRYVRRSNYNRHVRWCRNKFWNYDAQSDTFINYDGVVRRCRSPYR